MNDRASLELRPWFFQVEIRRWSEDAFFGFITNPPHREILTFRGGLTRSNGISINHKTVQKMETVKTGG